jgi:hypothetical protein
MGIGIGIGISVGVGNNQMKCIAKVCSKITRNI